MKTKLFLFFLIFIGFYNRVYGLNNNYSFWTDENHVAIFTRAILERGKPVLANGFTTSVYQWLQYWLSAIFSFFLGLNEFSIRLPSVFFGVLTILIIYLLGKEIFNRKVGLLSAFFVTFMNIEILFSRQARPYQSLQFFYLLGFYFIYKLTKEKKFNWRYFLGFLGCGILASLMHGLGIVIFFTGFIYLLIFKVSYFKKKWMFLGILLFLIFSFIFRVPIISFFSQIGKTNNLYYYRVFLTHNYLPFCFLFFIGGLFLFWQKKYQNLIMFIIVLLTQITITSYFLSQPFTRYFYPVFGFIIIMTAGCFDSFSVLISNFLKRGTVFRTTLLLLSVGIIIIPNNKFTFFPKQSYSLNEDMQEIPEVDWKKIYGYVENTMKENPKVVLVTNWMDLPVWYLGEGKLDYLLRKVDTTTVDSFSGAKIVNNPESFKRIIEENPKGLLIIDSWDDQVPDGIREFSQNILKKELEADRLYSVQPRYWPVTVYSWGM